MDHLVGRTVSHFQVLERLGEGGMGVVFRARDVKLDRPVALKFLHPLSVADETAKRRFVEEAKSASALDHPNICTVYEVDEADDGGLFIAMAFYQGGSLRERLREGPLSIDEAVDLATQVARGLQRAHGAGIVHRDVKPANVMLAGDVVKIVDFGVAKRGDLGLTRPGHVVGTAAYASPEQLTGDAVDHRADVWALGAVLYEMLAGEPPFDAPHVGALLHRILTDEPMPLRERRPEVPEPLAALVREMLRKSPSERVGSMADVLARLRSLAPGSAPAAPAGAPDAPPAAAVDRHVVGREVEIGALQACLTSAAAGRGLLACVAGEPGIGKTTLVSEFLDRATAPGLGSVTVARGQCSERLLGTEPYLPFLEALTGLLRRGEGAGRMRELAPLWYAQVASLSTADPEDRQVLEEVRTATQERMKRELVGFFDQASRSKPLVVFLEDLHWADVSTIDLLAHLSERLSGMRLLVVTTYRPADMALADHPFLDIRPDLIARGVCREITPGTLGRGDVDRYLELEFAGHAFPSDFARLVHATSEGSPLFMADLVRDLRGRGVIERDGGGWVLTQSPDSLEIDLPDSVRGMVQHKLSQVEGDDYELLVAGAVQGYEFDSGVLADALSIDPEDVEERLDRLERDHRLVRLKEERELPDGTPSLRYRFEHALYQNDFYGSLKPTKRARLSRAIAEALERHHPESQIPGVASELAMLLEAAREHPRAVRYFTIASEHAARRFALREAKSLAGRGLDLLERLPEGEARSRLELDLQMVLGPATMALEGFGSPGAQAALDRSHQLCRELQDERRLFAVASEVANAKQAIARYGEARTLADEALELARRSGDDRELIRAHTNLGSVLFYTGRWGAAEEHFRKGLEIYQGATGHAATAGFGHPAVYNLCTRALGLWILGHPDGALTTIEEALALAEELEHPFSLGFALGFAGNIHHGRREPEAVRRYGERGIDHAAEHGFPHWLAQGRMQLGWALAHQGKVDEGVELLREGWAGWQATGIELAMAYWPCWIVEAYAAGERAREAEDVVVAATELEGFSDESLGVPELARLRGVHLAEGETAEALIREALDFARERNARSYEIRAAVSLVRHLEEEGRAHEGLPLLREIYDGFDEGFDTPDLRDAAELLSSPR